jgi:hypothetical protein
MVYSNILYDVLVLPFDIQHVFYRARGYSIILCTMSHIISTRNAQGKAESIASPPSARSHPMHHAKLNPGLSFMEERKSPPGQCITSSVMAMSTELKETPRKRVCFAFNFILELMPVWRGSATTVAQPSTYRQRSMFNALLSMWGWKMGSRHI